MWNAVTASNAHLSRSSNSPKTTILTVLRPNLCSHRYGPPVAEVDSNQKHFRSILVAKTRVSKQGLLVLMFLLILSGFDVKQTPVALAQAAPGITSPAAGSAVSGSFPVMGTAVIEPFQRYELYIKQEPNGDDAYIYVSGGTQPITNGQLGVIDSVAFAPGTYSLRLRVVKLDGNYAEYFAPNISFNQGPAPTPTSSEPTPTPIPTATFTPAPQPTPIVGQVAQPEIETDDSPPTPTSEPVAAADTSTEGGTNSNADTAVSAEQASLPNPSLPGTQSSVTEEDSSGIASQLGEAIGLDRLREQFYTGMRLSAFAFVLIGFIFLAKALLRRFSFRN